MFIYFCRVFIRFSPCRFGTSVWIWNFQEDQSWGRPGQDTLWDDPVQVGADWESIWGEQTVKWAECWEGAHAFWSPQKWQPHPSWKSRSLESLKRGPTNSRNQLEGTERKRRFNWKIKDQWKSLEIEGRTNCGPDKSLREYGSPIKTQLIEHWSIGKFYWLSKVTN